MVYFLTFIHVVVCLFLVTVVLLQSGKAADLAGAFGGMGSQTAFGPRGTATLLSRYTAIAAALFMVTSLSLALVQTRSAGAGSVVDRVKPTAPKQASPAGSTTPQVVPLPGVSGGGGAEIKMPQITPPQVQTTPEPPKKK